MHNIRWTTQAWESYNATLLWLVEKWSVDVAQKLDDDVVDLLEKLSKHKHLCPTSQKLEGIRKCVISKYTSLLYIVRENNIELITFLDNRTNHPF